MQHDFGKRRTTIKMLDNLSFLPKSQNLCTSYTGTLTGAPRLVSTNVGNVVDDNRAIVTVMIGSYVETSQKFADGNAMFACFCCLRRVRGRRVLRQQYRNNVSHEHDDVVDASAAEETASHGLSRRSEGVQRHLLRRVIVFSSVVVGVVEF